jgi:serine/threonine protein phosphatase PrpC
MDRERLVSLIERWLLRPVGSMGVSNEHRSAVLGTDIGNKRKKNEDRVAFATIRSKNHALDVYMLSDGMGGMVEGDRCAAMALAAFMASLATSRGPLTVMIETAASLANERVFSEYRGRGGTTLSAVLRDKNDVYGLNIGDSRVYSVSQGEFRQLSVDDTLSGQLGKNYQVESEDNGLIQFVGMGNDLVSHIFRIAEENSEIALTSDGAHFIGDEAIKVLFKFAPDTPTAVRRILATSKWYGGHDNASLITIATTSGLALDADNCLSVSDPFGELRIDIENIAITKQPDVVDRSIVCNEKDVRANNQVIYGDKSETHSQNIKEEKKSTKKKLRSRSKKKVEQKPAANTKPELRIDLFHDEDSK